MFYDIPWYPTILHEMTLQSLWCRGGRRGRCRGGVVADWLSFGHREPPRFHNTHDMKKYVIPDILRSSMIFLDVTQYSRLFHYIPRYSQHSFIFHDLPLLMLHDMAEYFYTTII